MNSIAGAMEQGARYELWPARLSVGLEHAAHTRESPCLATAYRRGRNPILRMMPAPAAMSASSIASESDAGPTVAMILV